MYIGHGRLSIFNTEGGMRNFLMATIGVVGTIRRGERLSNSFHSPKTAER